MGKMIRKQIYIDPEQDARLKTAAKSRGISQAKLIRLALNSYMRGDSKDDDSSYSADWRKELDFMKNRPIFEGVDPYRWKNREEMYEEMLAERGKPVTKDDSDAKTETGWQEVMRKMREGHYAKVFEASFADDEPIWDRESLYAERISRLG